MTDIKTPRPLGLLFTPAGPGLKTTILANIIAIVMWGTVFYYLLGAVL